MPATDQKISKITLPNGDTYLIEDTKLQIAAVTSGTTYYPVVAANSTTAATRQYDATGLAYAGTNGTTSAVGTAKITLGNSTASGTANNKKGQVVLYGSTAYATTIDPGSPTANRTITLPNATGTVALTSDIPTVSYPVTSVNTKTGAVSLTASDVNAIASNTTGNTSELKRPLYLSNPVNNITLDQKINDLRANRLAFLPADQIIIEKTTDGGSTWVDAGISDAVKTGLFSQTRNFVSVPLLNGVKNINCGLRITFTAIKYNVPAGTAQTQKYNYWNSNYFLSVQRYNQLKEMYFWCSTNSDTLSVKLERATGANSTTWTTIFSNNNWGMTGWSGNNYISFSQGVFGGGSTQPDNYWNYRLTFFTRGPRGSTTLSGTNTTSTQFIAEIRGYGDSWWSAGNKYAASDHLYSWDYLKNATFPAKVTLGAAPTANMDAATKKYVDDNIPTKVSQLTNDSGYITSADVPEGASAYTGTISAVGTAASSGTNNGFARGDHVHNITSTTITTALGYTPYNSTNPNGYTSNTGTVTGVKINGTTIDPTSGVVDIGTVATSDTEVTQTILGQDASNSYPVLLSGSTSTSESTTGTTFKNSKLVFYPLRDSGSASLQVGNGFEILGRFNFYTAENESNAGTGISIGTESSSQSEMFYKTAGNGLFSMQHWTAEKASDGTPASGSYRDSIITMSVAANNPTIYLYNKSGTDTVTSYSRLNADGLYVNDGSAHMLNATGIDKVNALGTSTTICKTQNYTTAMTGNTWYTFNSFTLAAGTWIVQCTATFNSTSSTGTRIIRLTTGNTSTARVNWNCEATLGAHANSMNTLTFTTILTPTASTTYYLRAWSSLDVAAHATNNSGFVTYTRLI